MQLRVISISLLTALLALLVLFHVPYINGPEYWQWSWRRVPALRWYGLLLLAAAPIGIALHLYHRKRGGPGPLFLLMLASLLIKLASVAAVEPPTGAGRIIDIVRSREATSYFIDAGALSNFEGWFADYHEVLSTTGLHTRSKPPGPLLYWTFFIESFGYTDRAALIGGIALGVLAMGSVVATWWLVGLLTQSRDAGFLAVAVLALCPAFGLFFPMLDPTYIMIACALVGFWHLTITRNNFFFATIFGIILLAATMLAYPLLTLGLFLLIWSLFKAKPIDIIRLAFVAILTFVLAYVTLWFITSFDPIATFRSAWQNQYEFLSQHAPDRRWPGTIPFDLLDFAVGAAWLPLPLAIAYILRRDASQRKLAIVCLAQPLVVAFIGLVQTETARVWMFMLPLILIPAALELERWPANQRVLFFACMWLLLAVIGQNMTFINP